MASTVSFVNDPDKTVDQAIDGLVWSSPSLSRLEATRVVMRADWSKDAGKVGSVPSAVVDPRRYITCTSMAVDYPKS